MKFPRFFLAEPGLNQQLTHCVEKMDDLGRVNGLMLFAYDLLTWFDDNPQLFSIKLSCVARAEVCDNGIDVRLRHHFTLSAISEQPVVSSGQTFPREEATVTSYVMDRLPWQMIADGSVTIGRNMPVVEKLLATSPDDAIELEAGLYHLAAIISAGFKAPWLVHDIGLANVFTE